MIFSYIQRRKQAVYYSTIKYGCYHVLQVRAFTFCITKQYPVKISFPKIQCYTLERYNWSCRGQFEIKHLYPCFMGQNQNKHQEYHFSQDEHNTEDVHHCSTNHCWLTRLHLRAITNHTKLQINLFSDSYKNCRLAPPAA